MYRYSMISQFKIYRERNEKTTGAWKTPRPSLLGLKMNELRGYVLAPSHHSIDTINSLRSNSRPWTTWYDMERIFIFIFVHDKKNTRGSPSFVVHEILFYPSSEIEGKHMETKKMRSEDRKRSSGFKD